MDFILKWQADPEIFNMGAYFPVRYYSILFVTGLVWGYFIVRRIYIKENNSLDALEGIATYIFVGTILGARIGHCLFYDFSYYLHNPLEILLPIKKFGDSYRFVGFQGMASHGGTIGVIFSIWLYCKRTKTDYLWLVDRLSIAVPISAGFIRLGNFMNSEIFGKPTNGTWGVIFQHYDSIPRHPTQLYEAFGYFLISAILMYIFKRRSQSIDNGYIFGLFLTLLFMVRFIVEFYKENQIIAEKNMIINIGQILSLPFIFIGLVLAYKKRSLNSM